MAEPVAGEEREDDRELTALLEYLRAQRGFDFAGYKRTSLERRFAKRMEAVGVTSYTEYMEYLEVHPDEFAELFDVVLINVTRFFRDMPAWEYIRTEILPALVADKVPADPIRVWSAGCSSGEEAYTLGMLFVEAVGVEPFRERVKIYATDVDGEALDRARQATYPARDVQDVPRELLERCFERTDSSYSFRPDLRRSVIFGRNNLVGDAPISRIDLLVCRNTLMYFTAETQTEILARFNFALNDTGYLFLGKSEMLITHGDLFKPVSLKRRVFSKVSRATLRDRLAFPTAPGEEWPIGARRMAADVRDRSLDAVPLAQLAVDSSGVVSVINQQARALFGLGVTDLGRPLRDLDVSYRPVELRAGIEQAMTDRREVSVGTVEWTPRSGTLRLLDVRITPLLVGDEQVVGAAVTYSDVTRHARMREELERSRRELELAYEELQSTVEELETTNEELQSTNEELETTNEELQSSNEELETMNEELQSSNEELETMNDELRERTEQLHQVSELTQAVLGSMAIAVAVVDRRQVVQVWNGYAQELWGLRSEEAEGQHLMGVDIGFPVDQLKAPLRAVLGGEGPRASLVVPANNRRGKAIDCAVTCVPLQADGEIRGAIVLMEERERSGDGKG